MGEENISGKDAHQSTLPACTAVAGAVPANETCSRGVTPEQPASGQGRRGLVPDGDNVGVHGVVGRV